MIIKYNFYYELYINLFVEAKHKNKNTKKINNKRDNNKKVNKKEGNASKNNS